MTKGVASMSVNDEVGHGTIKAPASHDAEVDAQVLRKAMKGFGKPTKSGPYVRSCEMSRNFCLHFYIKAQNSPFSLVA